MAKKKTKDTKGLAGVIEYGKSAVSGKDIRLNKKVKPANQGGGPNYLGEVETVTVPKQWLSSPDHVVAELAYITPAEQKILLEANLYGSLDGTPNRGPGGLMSLQGDMGSGGYAGGAGDDPAGTDSAAEAAGAGSSSAGDTSGYGFGQHDDPSSPGQAPSGPTGGYQDNRDRATEKDYGVPDPTTGQIEAARGFGFGSPASKAMEASFALGFNQMGPGRGMGYNVSGREANVALGQIADRMAMAKAGYNLPGPLSTLGKIAGVMAQQNLSRIAENIKAGYPAAFDKQGQVQGAWGPGLVSGTMAYSGNPVEGNPGTGWVDDTKGEQDTDRKRDFGRTQIASSNVEVSAVPTSDPSYYGQGVGTATTNLYDPTKIDPYLASLYGITPSPIGASYDAADSSYSMPNSRKDAKSRTRLRGLDIFKPVSIVS